mgnify:CR=1 FL=1
MESLLLDNIDQPSDLKNLDKEQVNKLCAEIRQFLLRNISRTGGHLASNLGAVELTVALHRVMTTPMDKIVFDVGHQCYTHKLLTGRRSGFAKLRQLDGISGFPNPNESEHDAFIAGHGNTALSLSIGMAWAKKIRHEPGWVVAVIGDGAFTGGMVYEGMNNIGSLDNLLVVLNDNKMSISKNVGALSRYLKRLRTTNRYFDAKENVRSFLDHVPVVGTPLKVTIQNSKAMVRRAMYHSTMFEDMGFHYYGPFDGNNEQEVERILRSIHKQPGPHFLHVVTKKGKGYAPAESNPGNFHGVSKFDLIDSIPDPEVAPKESFSTVFGNLLNQEGAADKTICAITAAMKYGTGLQFFAHTHPERFFDVGMAEQHAVTFAAGLASQGMLPVVCIYSTFLQRSYDQIIHDVNLLQENVVFAIDRAGFVPGDGETHQGIFDYTYLSGIPNMHICAPKNKWELSDMMKFAVALDAPIAVRYPRGTAYAGLAEHRAPIELGKAEWIAREGGIALFAIGSMVKTAEEVQKLLHEKGYKASIINARFIKPIDEEAVLSACEDHEMIVTMEENVQSGGFGEKVLDCLNDHEKRIKCVMAAIPDAYVEHGNVELLKKEIGLDAESITEKILERL